ncbi:hypothetical protein K437DRAFT_258993 [Tilletiaria anomala UBC 951]|uniref:RING-type domain-containing protein n=1 Tax=Tilletiaria anomala (strain ATCC 24038 / CBS 436.72 / UBC 951) TaxID=1037660 RepID=A0A066VCZ4_TILAU|nr:uncharacterized protein K437DRAFT_258993 [Tilletiaria anomala UBC 951]KDN39622.1 hypothetical protein K437DRAFT_258993 [Tilletiaria anomala UBC 951]
MVAARSQDTAGAAAASSSFSSSAWRRFDFYDTKTVRDVGDFGSAPLAIVGQAGSSIKDIAAVCACRFRPPIDAAAVGAAACVGDRQRAARDGPVGRGIANGKGAGKANGSLVEAHEQASATGPLAGGSVLIGFTTGKLSILDPARYVTLASFYAFGADPHADDVEVDADGYRIAGQAPGLVSGGRITHISTDSVGRLITVGEEEGARFPILRIWNILEAGSSASDRPNQLMRAHPTQHDASTSRAWTPRLLAEAKVQHGARPTPVACVAHTPSLSFLSIGLADGTVLLMRDVDDALKSASPEPLASSSGPLAQHPAQSTGIQVPANVVALPKFKVILQQPTREKAAPLEPLTGLAMSSHAEYPVAGTAAHRPGARGVNARGGAGVTLASASAANGAGPGARRPGVRSSERKAALPAKAAGGQGSGPGARSSARSKASPYQLRGSPNQASSSSPPVSSSVYLFIVTPTRLLRYVVIGTGAGSTPSVVDDVGCALGCAAVVPSTLAVAPAPGPSIAGGSTLSVPLTGGVASGAGSGAAGAEAAGLAGKIVLARDEAIYLAGSEGREACLALEGAKAQVKLVADDNALASADGSGGGAAAASHHLILISPPVPASAVEGNPSLAGLQGKDVARVTIFDLDNKLIAYSGMFAGGVRHVWIESSAEPSASCARICVLSDDGVLTRLNEKPLRSKIEILYRKNLFLLAIGLARSYQVALLHAGGVGYTTVAGGEAAAVERARAIDPILASIHRNYAEHLYSKGDFDAAVNQFVKTIGWTQPSYVIRKFLDAQRITNLTEYLQELHTCGLANSDHTTLLLNCYTKLKDVAALDTFIRRPSTLASGEDDKRRKHSKSGSGARDAVNADAEADSDEGEEEEDDLNAEREQLPFDLDTAIRVCRQGGFFSHASYLAKRYEVHDEYMRIQVEDTQNFDDALLYIRESSPETAERMLKEYGRILLVNLPEATTTLLIELCSGHFRKGFIPNALPSDKPAAQPGTASSAAQYLSSYLHVANYLRSSRSATATNDRAKAGVSVAPQSAPLTYDPPPPQSFFAHFARNPAEFMLFLESVALLRFGQQVDMGAAPPLRRSASQRDLLAGADLEETLGYESEETKAQRAIWNTLLELYLRPSEADEDGVTDTTRRKKALRLLEQHANLPYDVTRALLLCATHDFADGEVYLFERLGLHEDIIHFWISRRELNVGEEDAHAKLMDALNTFGSEKPELYPAVLRHIVSSDAFLADHANDVMHILRYIEDEKLMSPLEVVQTLSRTPAASVGLVRDYLIRAIVSEREEIDSDLRLIESYRAETAKKQAEVAALTNEDQPRVFQVTTCAACGGPLDLPSVHFMCKHSYHQRCIIENEAECPSCARAHATVREIRRVNQMAADRHDLFLREVEEADDGFAATARMFSKGLLSLQAPE